jgi:hypothetical protein
MMKGAGSVIRPFFDVIAPFVIARNESDEAIHALPLWIASLRSQ